MTTRLPPRFGKYTQIERVGEGGFGHVYRAFDTELRRWVALKIPHQELLTDPEFVKQFKHEAQIAAQLDHPNIVRIYSIGEYQGTPYIEMEYVEGKTLVDLIREKGRFTPEEALDILAPVCQALEYAHKQGIIHRDIKPENILIREEDGRVLVTDFGLARARERSFRSGLSSTGVVVGTFRYMPPEQAEPKLGQIGPWSDVYSLGVVLYQMLTGRLPFEGESVAQLIYQHVHEPPEPPSNINIDIPSSVESVVLKALQKRPEERFQSAREMAAALRAAVEEGKVVAGVYAGRRASKPGREPRRNWQAMALGGILLAAFAVLVAVLSGRVFPSGGESPTKVAMVVAPPSPLSAQAPTPTPALPTPTSVPPPTPTPPSTPIPTPTPAPPTATATPTPSATPTPNWGATATAQARLLATAVAATLTAQPTATPTPTSRPTPTSTATPVTDTPPGSILEVGESWRQAGWELLLQEAHIDHTPNNVSWSGGPPALYLTFVLINRKQQPVAIRYNMKEILSATDNLGRTLELGSTHNRVSVPPTDFYTYEVILRPNTPVVLQSWGYYDYGPSVIVFADVIDPAVTEVIVTVSIAGIKEARWRIPIPH